MRRLQRVDELSGDRLRRLHRRTIDRPEAVRDLFERACRAGVDLRNGVDQLSRPRTARVTSVTGEQLCLETLNIDAVRQPQIYFNFDLDQSNYFFAVASAGVSLCPPSLTVLADWTTVTGGPRD